MTQTAPEQKTVFAAIEDAIEDVRQGKFVVVVDAADRENEGDLTIAAQFATPEAINFMATHARGLVCLCLTEDRCDELGLRQMAENTETDTVMGKDPAETWRDSPIRWVGKDVDRWSYEYGPQSRVLAGQGVGLVRKIQPAAEIVAEIWAEARAVMSGLSRYGG